MAMDAEMAARNVLGDTRDDAFDLVGQRAAIGVAQHHPARAGPVRRPDAVERVVRIGLEAVEEMLGVEQRLAPGIRQMGDGLRDHVDIFRALDIERLVHMVIPGLADDADRAGLGVQQRRQTGIVLHAAARPARHAEGGECRAVERRWVGEERVVGRVRARPAALHIVDADGIQRPRDGDLVRHPKIHPLGLRPVA